MMGNVYVKNFQKSFSQKTKQNKTEVALLKLPAKYVNMTCKAWEVGRGGGGPQ